MTTDTRTTRRGRPWQMLLLLLALLVVGAGRAAASYVEDTYRYSVTLSGSNTITIKAPVYDEKGADNWVDNGYLKVQVADKDGNFGSEKTVIWWTKDENSHDNDDSDLWTKFWTAMDGSFDITQGNSGSHFTLTKGDGTLRRLVYENSDGNTYDFTVVWRLPYDLLGKTLKFSWDVKCDYTNGLAWDTHYSVSPSGCEITMPMAQATIAPQATMATMSYSEVGQLEMPWFMGATTLTAVRYEYVDAYGITVWKEMPTNENNGTIYLDATVPHDNFAVVVSYKDNDGYDVTNISSGTQNLQMIHAPVGLTATPTGNHKAAVRLDWHIRHTGTNDITSSDFFEVQRSLTGQEADFVTIGSVPFTIDLKNPYFTFTDSTLVAAVTAAQLTAGSSLPNLTYRVRRMMTQTWGWDGNPCAQRVEAPLSGIHLQRLKSYSARWEDERAYSVRVTWDYVDEPNAVWDDRAKMMMVVTMKNSAGQPTDTLRYELTADERDSRTKVLDFSRPCLKYDVRMFVDPGTSPLRSWDLPDAMRIASAADWDAFCQRVKEARGERDVNAVLCADITTSNYCGADDATYRGTFDGNGHTLTFNKQNYNQQYVGPFYSVGDATIRNLHTAGTITSSQKFVGGIAAWSNGNTIIENCHSSVSIGSTVNGDATNGGIVAVCGGGQLTIVDCLFDGSLTGTNSNCIGGFVGWSTGKVNIVNSHFAPSKVEIKYDGCRNWARMSNYDNLSVTNSYYTTSIEQSTDDLFIIRSKADWTAFNNAVKKGSDKDINVLLNTDLSLTTEDIIGRAGPTSGWNYHGTFDGNGHTLSIDFSDEVGYNIGLFFSVARNTTIRNLRVTGKVSGSSETSPLIRGSRYGTNLNIDHVWVSADATSKGQLAGFVSEVREGNTIKMNDCLFDGNLTHTEWGGTADCFLFVGNISPNSNWQQTRLYERGNYVGSSIDYEFAMNHWYGNKGPIVSYYKWSDTDFCLSSHDFKELPEDCRNITDQDTVLARMNASMPGQWEKDGSGNAVPIIGMTGARAKVALGPGWQVVSGKAVPLTVTVNVNPTSLPDFYHEGTGRISKKLLAETRQSSVVLTWDLEDGVVDYFQVLRRLKGSSDDWDVVAPQVDKMGYEDKTVSPLENYEYKVVAVADCEGTHTSETDVVPGSCRHSGRVSGYVRMNDGTGVAGIQVEIAREGHDGDKTTVTTDESGYFMADDLSYYGGRSITYIVSPVSRDKIVLEVESRSVTFDNESNDEQLPEFTITSGHRFSGYVMYEGTSIPVKGAHFLVDGRELHDASGRLVETGYDGSFSFRVLSGNRRIQAVMDGHDFTGEGYFKGPEGHNFTDDVAQIYFYDKTKVLLAGRVAGGDDQGRLPLQNNLSRNNLGDGLTMVFTLEGDNTSWLVYDNLNPGLSQRIDTVWHKGGNHHTVVTTQRKRMEVKPDSITGEYELKLPPVRWKVQQIYCKGYATLFQEGQVSQVVDLTDCLNATDSIHEGTFMDVDQQSIYRPRETCKARFSRIYHAPVEIAYRQIGYDTFSYFGDKTYTATTVGGTKTEVPLAYAGKMTGWVDEITGKKIELDENETHTPKLTGTDGVCTSALEGKCKYEYLFDDDVTTRWMYYSPAWVEFKTDHLVSVKQYTMTTFVFNSSNLGCCPKSWTLKARANEKDAWKTISAVEDGKMTDSEVKAYTFDVDDEGFYKYFRLDVTDVRYSSNGGVQLAEFSLTCRGSEDMKPVPVYEGGTLYTFGHPVFSVGRKYPIEISVGERYIYNNDTRLGRVDRVSVGGGTVNVHNGMRNGMDQETVELNADGQGIYYLLAEATPRLLTGEDALHTVTMTLTQDGTTYEAEPLRGYTLNMFSTGTAKDVLVNGMPILVDVLRDPPGGGSSATLAKGSTLKYSYTLDMSLTAGLHLDITTGTKVDNYTGSVAAPNGVGETSGLINGADNKKRVDLDYAFDMEGHKGWTYTMNLDQDISTSTAPGMVGADADLFIGITQNIVTSTYSTIRAIPDGLYRQMLGRIGGGQTYGISENFGTLVHIAEGRDEKDSLYHLVRDESIGYGPEVKSQFVHSQKYIVTELIPQKVKELRSLMFTGTADEAQTQANATGKPVYRSLRSEDDERFAVMNTKDGKHVYNLSTAPQGEEMNYVIHLPAGTSGTPDDEVYTISQIIYAWVQMLANNEYDKLAASEHVANYDVDGGSTLSYSETFESEFDVNDYYHLPGIVGADYFDSPGSDFGATFASGVGVKAVEQIMKSVYNNYVNTQATAENYATQIPGSAWVTMYFLGKTFEFSLLPILNYATKDVSGESKAYSRKESFNISMDKLSHLNFDVYRAMPDTAKIKDGKVFDVFTSHNFVELTQIVEKNLRRGVDILPENIRYARGFVYRTRGGATANPWENARHTHFYKEGTLLDERTKKIENPKITVDRQSVSGVPYGEPVRFTIYLTNDSEDPEAAARAITEFSLYQDDTANPYGAKITLDGQAINSSGRKIILAPGEVVTKVVEVTGGNSFDLEGLTIGIASDEDWRQIYDEVKLDVHYLHQAGPVLIATPGDKWVMNTYAQYNDDRGWFLPVTISGFDKHQHNFDHIEFQYKESLRGDDSWTNLCSYYADAKLMEAASGVRELIPENGNIETQFYGEGTVMEKAYDLRAVLYCRNGNTFLTSASPIVSGVKDTRRPQLFGTPEPKTGIVKAGDDIVFNFSEDIEYNYLNAITNFEVKGEVNTDNVSEAVSLQFDGQGSLESEAQRNFSGKDVTIDMMIRPEMNGSDMPLFSHGTNGKRLQLWLTPEYKLKAVVDDNTYISSDTIVKHGFTQVALVIDYSTDDVAQTADGEKASGQLRFYNGGKEIGRATLQEAYHGTGRLIFGRTNEVDRMKSQYYHGRMMEARLWYRALTGGQVGTTYGSRRLTGYEMGLVDYYPMNEGSGDYAIDRTQGANAELMGAAWAMPRGLSLSVDWDDKGIALTQQALSRTDEQDYTLMFWFKTDSEGRGVLLSNGAGTKTEVNARNQFNIAFEAEKLMYRSNGMAVEVPGDWSDGQWHHLALTVNRSFNVANIYVDRTLRNTFATDSLGGISGGHPLIGAARTTTVRDDGTVETTDTNNALRGNIDELCLFAQALPLSLIQTYATKSPQGDETGLLTYLSFDRQERQKDNDIVLVAYPYSRKLYLDDQRNIRYVLDPVTKLPTDTLVRDYLFDAAPGDILAHITDQTAAPVAPYEELKNLNFGFTGEGHKVLVSLNESSARLNRRNIYVTLRDVEDKNGNAMASPQTACYFVNNSSLQWTKNHTDGIALYGRGTDIYLDFMNTSATSHTYTIEGCPVWLTFDKYTDVIGPQREITVRATVSKDLNVGSYDEIIYLTDEDGVTEPLYLTLTVEQLQPDWTWNVDDDLLKYSMNIAGKVLVNGEVDIDTRDVVGVFDRQNRCHGIANVSYSARTGESDIFITVYDSNKSGTDLYFKLWQYSTGLELMLTADGKQTIPFKADTSMGITTPVRFEGGELFVQTFNLKEGWNWVSFNVASEKLFNLNNLLGGLPWQNGDVLTEMSGSTTLTYTNGTWLATGSAKNTIITPQKGYAIKVARDIEFPVGGSIIKAADMRTVQVSHGWNGIGYTPMLNLSVKTALSDYYDNATPGDIIKSHDEFAYFTKTGGTGRWRGSLEYMKPGQGYMLLRNGEGTAAFTYPFYEPGSTFIDAWAVAGSRRAPASLEASPDDSGHRWRHTMSVCAVIEGFEPQEGDRLVAYAEGEPCGATAATVLSGSAAEESEPLYLNIGGEKQADLWFAIERDGDIVASTGNVLTFRVDDVVGSPDEPFALRFAASATGISATLNDKGEMRNDEYYDLQGRRMKRSMVNGHRSMIKKGVYIHNGNKVVIK